MKGVNGSSLVDRYERWLSRFSRNPSQIHRSSTKEVDLVGDTRVSQGQATSVFGRAATPEPNDQPADPPVNPFQATTPAATASRPQAPWSFKQTVLLTRRGRSSTILVWTFVGSVSAMTIWAFVAPIAETIAVQGKLEPNNNTRRIDTPAPGVVEAVLIREGQRVRKGDPLIRFDLREPRSRLAAAESIRQRLISENQIAAATLGDAVATARLSPNQRKQLTSQAQELESRLEGIRQELRKAEISLSGHRQDLTTLANITNRFAGLVATGAASELQLIQARQEEQQMRSQIQEDLREVARLKANLSNASALTSVDLRRKIEENLSQIAQSDSDIRLARLQIQNGQLSAPVDGVVFDLEVRPGSVVAQGTGVSADTGSKPLMKIVPYDALQARVYIPNRAVGFVRPGLRADLSIDTFQAGDFGYVPAEVTRIGSDALTADEQKRALGTDSQGLYYPAVLRLASQKIRLNSKEVPLQSGMTLTADIKLRERRPINILFSFLENQRRNLERLR